MLGWCILQNGDRRLQFLTHEQITLRADCYQDLWDAILDGDEDPNNVSVDALKFIQSIGSLNTRINVSVIISPTK